MRSLKNLSNELLNEAYDKAVKLNLKQDFRQLIKDEMKERGLQVQCLEKSRE